MHRTVKGTAALPPGVLALGNSDARHRIFWIHYLSANLARRIGVEQSFFSVGLTAEDFLLLGEAPTLGSIASCLVEKILATQPDGPYTIGGLCIGGVLAYEIASQLQAAGREVSLLVLVDPPHPSYLESCNSLTRKVSYLRYVVKRAGRVGPRLSFVYFREHLLRRLRLWTKSNPVKTERSIAQAMVERAAFEYRPKPYQGKVLLLLASERPPHVNFLPGWQAVIPDNLHTQYVKGHHRDLITGPDVEGIAEAIVYHLNSTLGEGSPQMSEEMAKGV